VFWLILALLSNVVEQIMIVHVMSSMDMVTFILLFYLFSASFTFLFHLRDASFKNLINWRDVRANKFLFLGYVGGAFLGNLFWFSAVLIIGIGMTGFILVFIKILTTAYSYRFMHDRFSVDKAVAFAAGIFGLLVFSFSADDVKIAGIMMALLSCFGFATEVICRKKLVDNNVNAENAILIRTSVSLLLWGCIFIGGLMIGTQSMENITSIELETLGLILFIAFLGGLLVHLFVFYGMKTVKVSQYEALSSVKPVLLVLGGVFFFGESITSVQVGAGMLIILSTLYFLSFKIRSKTNLP